MCFLSFRYSTDFRRHFHLVCSLVDPDPFQTKYGRGQEPNAEVLQRDQVQRGRSEHFRQAVQGHRAAHGHVYGGGPVRKQVL